MFVTLMPRIFPYSFMLFGIIDSHTAAQTTDQVLIQVVDQFKKTGSDVDARHRELYLATAGCPFIPKITESLTDAEYLRILNSDNMPIRIEYGASGESIADRALEDNSFYFLGTERGLEHLFGRNDALQQKCTCAGKSRNNRDLVTDIGSVPCSDCDMRQGIGCDSQLRKVKVNLVVRNLAVNGHSGIGRALSVSENNDLNIVCILSETRFLRSDNMISRDNYAVGRSDKSVTHFIPSINLNYSLPIDPIDFLSGQCFLSICVGGENKKTGEEKECSLHSDPLSGIRDAMRSIACFPSECMLPVK